jgi:two-component sensor histidine kinase
MTGKLGSSSLKPIPSSKKLIRIKSQVKKKSVVIQLIDNGPGISEADLIGIFDPFYTKKKKKGLDVGLSICHEILGDHGGYNNSREFIKRWCYFYHCTASNRHLRSFKGVLMKNYNILLVDDDLFILKSVGDALESEGYIVTKAESGEEAIQMINASPFDLVITDLVIKKIDGFQVIKAIKNQKNETMIMILTGYSDINLAIDALRLGVDDYALKPCEHEELMFRLQNCFKKLEANIKIKQAEDQIKTSLMEKEVLLLEIHHRVKNNMTVISSLLKLQMASVSDKNAKDALQDSQNRVQAMSTIHETLYRSDHMAAVEVKMFLIELGRIIFKGYALSDNIQLILKVENVIIGVKQASPLGLIVNELITNSLKYAFPENRQGEIMLSLQQIEDQLEMEYEDNGVGIPKDFDWKSSNTLGLKLVRTLVENQLDGSIDMERNNGTKFTIKFNIET